MMIERERPQNFLIEPEVGAMDIDGNMGLIEIGSYFEEVWKEAGLRVSTLNGGDLWIENPAEISERQRWLTTDRVKEVVKRPVLDMLLDSVLTSNNNGLTIEPDILQSYYGATVIFPSESLLDMNPMQFLALETEFFKSIIRYSKQSKTLLRRSLLSILPGSYLSVLYHELEHLKALPENVQQLSRVHATFSRGHLIKNEKILIVSGSVNFPEDRLEKPEKIDCCLAPTILSHNDADSAVKYVFGTGDRGLLSEVNRIIEFKPKVDEFSTDCSTLLSYIRSFG